MSYQLAAGIDQLLHCHTSRRNGDVASGLTEASWGRVARALYPVIRRDTDNLAVQGACNAPLRGLGREFIAEISNTQS